jgi:hypothetical protein
MDIGITDPRSLTAHENLLEYLSLKYYEVVLNLATLRPYFVKVLEALSLI